MHKNHPEAPIHPGFFASAWLTANIRTGHPGKHGKHALCLRPGQESLIQTGDRGALAAPGGVTAPRW